MSPPLKLTPLIGREIVHQKVRGIRQLWLMLMVSLLTLIV
jgi:hypothetical protein